MCRIDRLKSQPEAVTVQPRTPKGSFKGRAMTQDELGEAFALLIGGVASIAHAGYSLWKGQLSPDERLPRNDVPLTVEILQTGFALLREKHVYNFRNGFLSTERCVRSAKSGADPARSH